MKKISFLFSAIILTGAVFTAFERLFAAFVEE